MNIDLEKNSHDENIPRLVVDCFNGIASIKEKALGIAAGFGEGKKSHSLVLVSIFGSKPLAFRRIF